MADMLNTSFSSQGQQNVDTKSLVFTNHVGPNHHHPHHQIVPMKEKARWQRLVEKNGRCNVNPSNRIDVWRYAMDLFTTSVDMPWRYNIAMIIFGFLINWLFFGFMYYIIALFRGDFDNLDNPDWKPCFRNFKSFKSALMFSIETQTTIGYGYRCPTEDCAEALFFLVFQTIWANFLEAFIIGSFIAKFSRPKMRAKTIIFSKTSCITMKDGKLIFHFRVADLRKSSIVEGHLRLQLIRHHMTREGRYVPYQVFDMNIGHESGLDRIFLVWPIQIVHKINEDSPLYNMCRDSLLESNFEIIAVLEGIVEATGTTTQARTSYLPNEIEWGYDFKTVVTDQKGVLDVNLDHFHQTFVSDTTPMSAKEVDNNLLARGYSGSDENCNVSVNQHEDSEDTENKSNARMNLHIRRMNTKIESTL